MTEREIVPVPFFPAAPEAPGARPARLDEGETLRVGFIGAMNTVNVLNMQRFLDALEKHDAARLSVEVAGNVCEKLSTKAPHIKLAGRVDDAAAFYKGVDVIVAPMEFSTGIKVKVGEALGYGKPVVSTRDGFDGYPATDPFHTLESIDDVCKALVALASDRERLKQLEQRSEEAANTAREECGQAYAQLADAIRRRLRTIVFLTDRPAWAAASFDDERVAQWCNFCGHIAPTWLVYVGAHGGGRAADPALLEKNTRLVLFPEDIAAAMEAIGAIARSSHVIEIAVSLADELARTALPQLKQLSGNVTIDAWRTDLMRPGLRIFDGAANESLRDVETTALRYTPEILRGQTNKLPGTILAVLCGASDADRAGVAELANALEGDRPLARIECGTASASDALNALLAWLKREGAPDDILAVGEDARVAEACRSLAEIWKTRFLPLSENAFPFMLADGEDAVRLCECYADVARYLREPERWQTNLSTHVPQTGWSTYRRLLLQRG
jgi:hypothetical protein